MATYNGWSNYATWRVNLEIFDGYDASDLPRDIRQAEMLLMSMADDLIYEQTSEGLARDYALAFLGSVNWLEIARHMLEGVEQ